MASSSWDQLYTMLEPAQVPWNAGGPDPDLVRLVDAGSIPAGRAVDLGCGQGHDAIYLVRKNFSVVAADISPTAIKLAQENAERAGLPNRIDFRPMDALQLLFPPGSIGFINDRGFFHFLPPDKRPLYLHLVGRSLALKGVLLLRTFSDQEPPGTVPPYRFTKQQLKDLFSPVFDCLELKEGAFAGPQKPNPKSYLLLLQKR